MGETKVSAVAGCPVCGRQMRLTKHGKIATHAPAHRVLGYGAGGRGTRRLNHCAGSGVAVSTSPDLLAACMELMSSTGTSIGARERAVAAITKARGTR